MGCLGSKVSGEHDVKEQLRKATIDGRCESGESMDSMDNMDNMLQR